MPYCAERKVLLILERRLIWRHQVLCCVRWPPMILVYHILALTVHDAYLPPPMRVFSSKPLSDPSNQDVHSVRQRNRKPQQNDHRHGRFARSSAPVKEKIDHAVFQAKHRTQCIVHDVESQVCSGVRTFEIHRVARPGGGGGRTHKTPPETVTRIFGCSR